MYSKPKITHKSRALRVLIIISIVFTVLFAALFWFSKQGANRKKDIAIDIGNFPPPTDGQVRDWANESSELIESLIEEWSDFPTDHKSFEEGRHVHPPRIIISKLLKGKDVEFCNQYLQSVQPYGTVGSTWALNPHGDWDFALLAYTPLLYLFGDKPELLYPETLDHLLSDILTEDGADFNMATPKTLGLIEDTENHILMIHGSRYLKNRWLYLNGNEDPKYDNRANGVEGKLVEYIDEILRYGVYEFNSDPYNGYTLSALLSLEAFAGKPVSDKAIELLDLMNWQYALASFQLKNFPPYRRAFKDAYRPGLYDSYHTVMMTVWASLRDPEMMLKVERGKHHAFWAAIMSYRPHKETMDWVFNKPSPYFVQMGRGHNSCPELYSGDEHYLLSAGGSHRGRMSLIMPKPIMLFLNDDARVESDCFRVYGPGEDLFQWNNTGVFERFACAAGPVRIPEGQIPVIDSRGWQIYKIGESRYLFVYSEADCGILYIDHSSDPNETLEVILKNNSDTHKLRSEFTYPDGLKIKYDLLSPRHLWVITDVDGEPTERNFEKWPHVQRSSFLK